MDDEPVVLSSSPLLIKPVNLLDAIYIFENSLSCIPDHQRYLQSIQREADHWTYKPYG